MKTAVAATVLLALAVVATSVAVVYAKHQSRMLFVVLQELERERDQMDVEWGQLQLEQSTLTTHGKVEEAARDNLQMVIPPAEAVVMVHP
jgi:cell division protein FtsL